MSDTVVFCPWCSMRALFVASGKQLFTDVDVTAIHCNKCNKTTRLLGVRL